ncbi:MAG: HlyD family efflux transporter periplasmic adaptor subunit [Candidatus Krumholzibacteria bacterium]|jgi:multidrug resistance efflux pump|nr:HlyD family efflux transporter periplasmic adaptor subunit [Candidatus Krumholzibacteria bacterium]
MARRVADRIAIPWPRRLRRWRAQALPLVVFLLLVAVVTRLWRDHVLPVELIGEAQAQRAEVVVPVAGQVVQMHVRPFERVHRGEPLAMVMTTDPVLLESRLAVIRAELELLLHSFDPVVGRQRSALDYERLRVELMNQRVDLASAEVNLVHAENQYERIRRLHAEGMASDADYEIAMATHTALAAEVSGRQELVSSLTEDLARLHLPALTSPEDPLRAAIRLHEERLREVEAELGPVTLRAPIDGMVGLIYRNPGEHVLAGEPLLTVMAETSDRIIAYLRQPIRVRPQVGMAVRVQARTREGGAGVGEVLHVSAQLELLPEDMLAPGMQPEKALPVLISLPEGCRLLPGERVGLALLP